MMGPVRKLLIQQSTGYFSQVSKNWEYMGRTGMRIYKAENNDKRFSALMKFKLDIGNLSE